jgi:hypothetical protein
MKCKKKGSYGQVNVIMNLNICKIMRPKRMNVLMPTTLLLEVCKIPPTLKEYI